MQILDVRGLAEMLDVSERTVYDLVRTNAIPYMKVGRLLRFDLIKVMAHISVAPAIQMEIPSARPKKKPAPDLYIKPVQQGQPRLRPRSRNPWIEFDEDGDE